MKTNNDTHQLRHITSIDRHMETPKSESIHKKRNTPMKTNKQRQTSTETQRLATCHALRLSVPTWGPFGSGPPWGCHTYENGAARPRPPAGGRMIFPRGMEQALSASLKSGCRGQASIYLFLTSRMQRALWVAGKRCIGVINNCAQSFIASYAWDQPMTPMSPPACIHVICQFQHTYAHK